MADAPIRTAVILGDHPFDVPAFHAMLRAMPDVDPYLQNLEDFTADFPGVAADYDVVLFYNFHQNEPGEELPWFKRDIFDGINQLGRPGQGIFCSTTARSRSGSSTPGPRSPAGNARA